MVMKIPRRTPKNTRIGLSLETRGPALNAGAPARFPRQGLFGGFRHLLALPQIPSAQVNLIDHLVGLFRFLRRQEGDRAADLDRLRLQAGIDLGIDRAEHGERQARPRHGHAVPAHQHDRAATQRLGQRFSELGVRDQHVGHAADLADLEHGHLRREKRGNVEHRLHRHLGGAEGNDSRGMRVDHRLHVGPGLVDLGMNETLQVAGAAARIDGIAVEIVFQDVGRRDQGRGERARHQEPVGIGRMANADVTEPVEHALTRKHVVGDHEVVQQRRFDRSAGSRPGIAGRRLRAARADGAAEGEPAGNQGLKHMQALHRQLPFGSHGPMPSADQRAAALGGSSLVPRRGYSGSPPSQWPSRSRYGNAYRAAPYWRGEPQRWIIGMPFPDIDVAAGTVTIAIWQSAILAGLLLLFVFLAVYRAQWPTVVDRLAERDRADERRALDQRILELSARALAPGSALGCLEPNLGETIDAACEKAVFADPETIAGATAYVAGSLSLLADAAANGWDVYYDAALAALRHRLEIDRFGLVAQVLAGEGCSAAKCEKW